MRFKTSGIALWVFLCSSGWLHASIIQLSSILSNPGYETGTAHINWTEMLPNANFLSTVLVNPLIQPLDPTLSNGTLLPALAAPDGVKFIGVPNPTINNSIDVNGKLGHSALAVSFTSADTFVVNVWASRGRVANPTNNSLFSSSAVPDLNVALVWWGSGATPTVNAGTNNWSRSPAGTITTPFTNWNLSTDLGHWTSQLFTFAPNASMSFLALTISGRNMNHDQYVAWDVQQVPEPSTLVLAALGLAGGAALVARRRRLVAH